MRIARIKNTGSRRVSLLLLFSMAITEIMLPMQAMAAPPKASVEETLYLNLDCYGKIEKANVVKGVSFNSEKSYTDFGDYTDIINMSTAQKPDIKGDRLVWDAPENGGRLFFQGAIAPDKAVAPWSFDIGYKLNGIPVNAEELAGASGLIEMDIDAYPNTNASRYMQDNFMLIVAVPIDGNKIYSVDAPGSQMTTLGQYSGVMYVGLPGKEQHYQIRMGSEGFETVGAVIMMSPGTLGELSGIKDIKELKDKFRGNTNAVLDSMEALMDNVSDMSEQLELSGQMLKELQAAKNKISLSKDSVFAGNDEIISELYTLSERMEPLEDSLKTAQWMVYDLNRDMNRMDREILSMSARLRSLSSRLKALGGSMGFVNNLSARELSEELKALESGIGRIQEGIQSGREASGAINTAMGRGGAAFTEGSIASASNIIKKAAIDNAGYEEEYLPEAVLEAVNTAIEEELRASGRSSLSELSPDEAKALLNSGLSDKIAGLLAVYDALTQEGSRRISAEELLLAAAAYSDASTVPDKYKNLASRYVGRLRALNDIASGARELGANTASYLSSISGDLSEINSSLEGLGDGLSSAFSSEASERLISELVTLSSGIRRISEDGGAVAFQTARFLNSARSLAGEMDRLAGTLNEYYPDVQMLLQNSEKLLGSLKSSSRSLSETLSIVNNTLRSASENFGKSADAGLKAGELAVENAGRMLENTEKLKEAGASLRESINKELDEKEAESNFLNMDPDAVKHSFTSDKNPEPVSLSIVARSGEISIQDSAAELMDAEDAEPTTGPLKRIGQIFVRMWQLISGIFGNEE